MKPVIAVTGASGSLGRVLVERLAREPSVEKIVALDRRAPGWVHPKVEFVSCDVRDGDIGDYMADCGALVHLAFIVERGSRDQALVQEVNVGGTRNVIEAAAAAGVQHVVHASSIAAYGFHPENLAGPLTEDAPIRGNDDFYYARTKAECEHWLDEFERAHPTVKVARLRPSVFLGPRGRRSIDTFRKRVFPVPVGRTPQPVHVTHEDDVAEAFFCALKREATGAFNIATDEPLAVRDWARAMGKLPLPIPTASAFVADLAYRYGWSDVDPVWLRAGSEYPIVVSAQKARRELRWRPRYDTTGQVLRAFADAPTAAASLGTKLLFGSAAAVTRFRGSLPVDKRGRDEMLGMNGIANIVFTGEHPSEWRVEFADGSLGIRRGIHPDAKATITMKESDFSDMLAGKLSFSTATMTGKVRCKGDSGYNFLIGGIVGGFRSARKGRPAARLFTSLILRGNGVAAAQPGGTR
jgi:nucleoside-diphosphate-sugar epimerase